MDMSIIEEEWVHCPNCPDQGWYYVYNRHTDDYEPEQCEFCYTVENSYFNKLLKEQSN